MSVDDKKKIVEKFLKQLNSKVVSLMVSHFHHLNPTIVNEQIGLNNLRSLILASIAYGTHAAYEFKSQGIEIQDIINTEVK